MSVVEEIPTQVGFVRRVLGAFRTLILGTFFCVWAPTSLIVLGWLMRRMRHVALTRAGLSSERPSWIMGRSHRWYARLLGGFAANMREGIMASFSLALATAPFTVIWLLSWWAGWENSFSKGYEQAFVGPMLGLAGVAVFCVLMIWIPMALAHQAVENRALALFEWRMVRSAVRHSGWGYVFLAVVTVVMSLPLFAGRGLVTFASGIIPGFDEMSPAEALEIMGRIDLALAAYVFLGLVILRGWGARLYGNAVARALEGPDTELWHGSALAEGRRGGRRSWKLTHWMRGALLVVIWFGLAAQIFVGQFLNHDWHIWVTHPAFLLPWAG